MAGYMHVGALNIISSPPSKPEEYERILIKAFKLQRKTKLHGDWVGLIGRCQVVEGEEGISVQGEFYKYIDLEATRDWFNLQNGKKAAAADLAEIKIPEYLKPHFQFLPFVFFLNGHRLFFVLKDRKETLSTLQAQKIVKGALAGLELGGKKIDVIVEQSQETLDSILSMQRLRSLTIEVIPPNAFSQAEDKLLKGMTEERVTRKTLTLVSDKPNGLDPQPSTKILAGLALSLGKVIGRGSNAGQKIKTVSTSDHPYVTQTVLYSNLELRAEKLYSVAQQMLDKIMRR